MNIDSIKRGIVIDHIKSGNSMRIYRYLHLDDLDCSVAIIKNVKSSKMERKDIIKIDDKIDINLDILGFIDPDITVNIIENGEIVEKKNLSLPEKVEGILTCRNPRCITAAEPSLKQIFMLHDEGDRKVYRCFYCDSERK